jgi:hypothetical protein
MTPALALLAAGCVRTEPEGAQPSPPDSGPPDTSPSPTAPPSVVVLSGVLPGDTVWTPDQVYLVEDTVTVPAGATLTVLAGTEIRFAAEAQLVVAGLIRAEGTEEARIRLVADPDAPLVSDLHPSLPDAPAAWGGVQLTQTPSPDNLMSWVDLDRAQTMDGAVGVRDSEVVLEHLTVTGTRLRSIYSHSSSVIVRDSVFPTMFTAEDRAILLGLNNEAEYIKGEGEIPAGGHYVIERNVFGIPKGHNDVIDVNGTSWPGPVLEVRDNVFLGGGDEAIDGGGDLLLDGNLFQAFVKDADNTGSGDANCLSTGDVLPSLVVATRNVYVGVDHVANLKRGSFGYFEHNTVIGISPSRPSLPGDNPPRTLLSSAIRLLIPDTTDPVGGVPRDPAGYGASLDGNVFVDVPETVFGNPDENGSLGPWTSQLSVSHTLVPSSAVFANSDGVHGRAFEYLVGAPVFVDPANGDYSLAPGSIGAGAGRHGLDLGAAVGSGATVCCLAEGTGPTASVEVGGPGLFSFLWRLDGGAWSEVEIADPRAFTALPVPRTAQIVLEALSPGAHVLEVQGRDFAGVLQPTTAVPFNVEP